MAYVLISECLRATGYHDDAAAQLAVARSMTGLTQLQSDLPALVG